MAIIMLALLLIVAVEMIPLLFLLIRIYIVLGDCVDVMTEEDSHLRSQKQEKVIAAMSKVSEDLNKH